MANKTLYILTGILLLTTPSGAYFLMNADTRIIYSGVSSLFITVQFAAAVILFFKYFGMKNLIYIPVIFIFAMLVETAGVKTGFPFGSYYYSDVLQPQIFGVPAAIGMSWIMTSLSSFLIVRTLSPLNPVLNIIPASVLLTGYDIILEPFAAHINKFWVWENGSVPLSNYIAWFLVSVAVTSVLNFIPRKNSFDIKTDKLASALPFVLMGINLFQFSAVNFTQGYVWQTLTGLAAIAAAITICIIPGGVFNYNKKFINA